MLSLSIGFEDEFDGFLSALWTGASVLVFLAIIVAALIAFDRFDRWRDERRSPVGRLGKQDRTDPFGQPFGDVPTVNSGLGARPSLVVAERSPAEQGAGFTSFELRQFQSAGSAGPAGAPARRGGEGSGGVGIVASRGPAAARSPWLAPWYWGKRRGF